MSVLAPAGDTQRNEMPNFPLTRFIDTNGDGTGSIDMAQDFSIASETFFIQPAPKTDIECGSFTFIIDDNNIESDKYGGIQGGLANGIDLRIANINFPGGISFLGGRAIKTNSDWMFFTRHVDVDPITVGSGKPSRLLIHFDLTLFMTEEAELVGSSRGGVSLKGHREDRIEIVINDNLTPLNAMCAVCKGMVLTDGISSKI